MEQTTSQVPAEAIEAYNLYIHGEIDRSAFLSRVNKVAVSTVAAAVMHQNGRFDLRHVRVRRRAAVERNRRRQVGAHAHRQRVRDAATEAEAGHAESARAVGARLQPHGGGVQNPLPSSPDRPCRIALRPSHRLLDSRQPR